MKSKKGAAKITSKSVLEQMFTIFKLACVFFNVVYILLLISFLYGYLVAPLTRGYTAFDESSPYFYVVVLLQLVLPSFSFFNIFILTFLLLLQQFTGKLKILSLVLLFISIFFVVYSLITQDLR